MNDLKQSVARKAAMPPTDERERIARSNAAKFDTREAWLEAAVEVFRGWFVKAGAPMPATIKVTCGWPARGGTAAKGRVLAECWHPKVSADGATQIFVSPYIGDAARALDVLLHECVHAALGVGTGHGPAFAKLAFGLGLAGKPTATIAGEALQKRLVEAVIPALGKYPHGKMEVTEWEISDRPKKQVGSRMVKCSCESCGYTVRTTRKWLEVATPTCPFDACPNYQDPMIVGSEPKPGVGRPAIPVPANKE